MVVQPDVLGHPYQCRTLDLGHDDEGPVIATLVHRRAARPGRRAVLYVHGFVDYFFQTHLADFYTDLGWDFYAIDLRKYGRSLGTHQTPNFCRDVTDYYPDLDQAAHIIRNEDGHDTLLVNGHSTGGLIVSLWAHDRRDTSVVDGIFLNSPFFDFNAPWLVRRPVLKAVAAAGRARPYRVVPFGLSSVYGQSLHADHNGEWTYDLAWKPLAGFPIRAGWLHAIRAGQQRLRAGLDIHVPILLACSTNTYRKSGYSTAANSADAVLDVEHMVRWAPRLGRHVTLVRVASGLHDLTLSAPPARQVLFTELGRWVGAYLDEPPAGAPPTRPAATPTDRG